MSDNKTLGKKIIEAAGGAEISSQLQTVRRD